jgi:hypothetical protein
MRSSCERLPADVVISQCEFSRSQVYEWRKGVKERKHRKRKIFSQETVENAVGLIMDYPHMGGREGQLSDIITNEVFSQIKLCLYFCP